MRTSLLLMVALVLLFPAAGAVAETLTIRTGQVAGAPGSCSANDDSFRFFAPNPTCGQPILATAFQAADFDAACAGPPAVVINPYTAAWTEGLDCDPAARWIASSIINEACWGSGTSVLYCAQFTPTTQCAMADSIRICWAVDDFLGDPPSFPGPNPGGIYVNGVDLGPSFSGPGSFPEHTAVAYNVPLSAGANSLAVYQRDAGCGISGLILSATVYTPCGTVPLESTSWGAVKSIFR